MKRLLAFHSNSVWPTPFMMGMFVTIYGILTFSFWLIQQSISRSTGGEFDAQPEADSLRMIIVICGAVIYAAFRLARFHPLCSPAYSAWLKSSPWTAARPLPLGPVHLVWQDAAIIGVLAVLCHWHAHQTAAVPVVAFGIVYFAGLTALVAFTRRWWHCLSLGFLWPSLFLPAVYNNEAGFAVVGAIMIVAWHGYWRSLKAFPWDFIKYNGNLPTSILNLQVSVMPTTTLSLGWPFMALSPKLQPPGISLKTGLALGALAGWSSYCIIVSSEADPTPGLVQFLAVMAALFRLIVYCSGAVPPFSIFGRLGSGRLIVPSYDKVFFTPLAVVLVGMVGAMAIKLSGPWHPAVEGCSIMAVWWVAFCGGPTMRNWLLTGQHRLRPQSKGNANTRQMIRPV